MCPLYPFHVIILYLCLILPLLFAVIEGADELSGRKWNLNFMPKKVTNSTLKEYETTDVKLSCDDCPPLNSIEDPGNLQLILKNEKENIASLSYQVSNLETKRSPYLNSIWSIKYKKCLECVSSGSLFDSL